MFENDLFVCSIGISLEQSLRKWELGYKRIDVSSSLSLIFGLHLFIFSYHVIPFQCDLWAKQNEIITFIRDSGLPVTIQLFHIDLCLHTSSTSSCIQNLFDATLYNA